MCTNRSRRHALPKFAPLNFILHEYSGEEVLFPKLDPQAKALGEYLRARRVDAPETGGVVAQLLRDANLPRALLQTAPASRHVLLGPAPIALGMLDKTGLEGPTCQQKPLHASNPRVVLDACLHPSPTRFNGSVSVSI